MWAFERREGREETHLAARLSPPATHLACPRRSQHNLIRYFPTNQIRAFKKIAAGLPRHCSPFSLPKLMHLNSCVMRRLGLRGTRRGGVRGRPGGRLESSQFNLMMDSVSTIPW